MRYVLLFFHRHVMLQDKIPRLKREGIALDGLEADTPPGKSPLIFVVFC